MTKTDTRVITPAATLDRDFMDWVRENLAEAKVQIGVFSEILSAGEISSNVTGYLREYVHHRARARALQAMSDALLSSYSPFYVIVETKRDIIGDLLAGDHPSDSLLSVAVEQLTMDARRSIVGVLDSYIDAYKLAGVTA